MSVLLDYMLEVVIEASPALHRTLTFISHLSGIRRGRRDSE